MERTDVIKMIGTLMQDNNIKPSELSDVVSKQDYTCVKNICKEFYDNMVAEIGKTRAYDWACNHIDSYWRDVLDIQPAKIFKHATVTLEVEVMVPQNFDKSDIRELVQSLWHDNYVEPDVEIGDENIEECDIDRYNYANYPGDYEAGDF